METENKESIAYLNYLIRTYQSLTDMMAATKNRLQSLPGDHPVKFDRILHGEDKEEGLETIKGRISRLIGKELPAWAVWERWLKDVPGIGNVTAAELIMLYYYKYIPVCKDCVTVLEKQEGTYWCESCQKSVKGDGNLDYLLGDKDFQTISKWWAYMGRDIKDGAMRKRKKGEMSNWSSSGRRLGFLIGESFNKQQPDHKYKAVLLAEKAKYEKSQPEISKGWRHNKAKNNAIKLFLAHFWTVCRTLDGKPVSDPYAMVIMGHTNYIKPFYFEG
ncbi:MAG: hypothetical protein H8D87_00610 [Deltaproteobacteria bacterium]|nr:hypothetical protein [Candidatus Desulfobacula maris]